MDTEIKENKKPTAKKVDENVVQEPKIALSIIVLETGSVIVMENGQPIDGLTKIEFTAEVGQMPKYTITKNILNKKVGN